MPAAVAKAAQYALVDALLGERNSQRSIMRATGILKKMKINVFFRKHWGEVEDFEGAARFFSADDEASVNELYIMSPTNRYKYGKVSIENQYFKLIEEECELDYFFSTIQFAKKKIYSGEPYTIDNSYFKWSFLYEHNKLYIKYKYNHIITSAIEFNEAFVESASQYYSLLLKYHKESPDDYAFLLEDVKDWLS